MEATGAQIIIGILEREGIKTVAGIPGGANLPLYDELGRSRIRHVLVRHEQAAGFIAQGMARRTGEVAVCFATSGPGVTNLLTAVADAKLDSIPIVAITGQVPRAMIGTDAFQEIDTYGLSLPIAKHSVLIESAAELLEELPRAFEIARSGRPGPVVIDVPKDVQLEKAVFDAWPEAGRGRAKPQGDAATVERIAAEIAASERPVIYAGAGCATSAETAAALAALARKERIPVTTTLLAIGAFPQDDALSLGMLGMHGTRAANRAIAESDLLIAVGARFDDRATGKISRFAERARIVHIDIDGAEIGKLKRPTIGMVSDALPALRALEAACPGRSRPEWERRIGTLKRAEAGPERAEAGHPARFLSDLSRMLDGDAVVATDVGQHQMWAAQAFSVRGPRSFLTSGGLGTMGFGLPAAIGAALAEPGKRVVCVTGDGSLMMNIQELATLAETGARVAVVLMDNAGLGMVRQQQELFYRENYVASDFAARPDFAALAAAFGIPAVDLEREADPEAALRRMLDRDGPSFIRVPVAAEANVFPMVPPGAANEDAIGSYLPETAADSATETDDEEEESA